MTRQQSPVSPPVVLTVAGSDSGGGAGIQADLKTIEAGGAFGTSVITSVTAQNTTGVEDSHLLPLDQIEAQLTAVLDDFDVAAVKTGMLAAEPVIDLLVEYADRLPNLVVDPVMVATSGDRLLDPAAEDAYERLLTEATLVTPNADEAAVLTGVDPETPADLRTAGEELREMGVDAALVKGGHVPGDSVVDVLVTQDGAERFEHTSVDTEATHGSGCTLSSAVATRLASGDALGRAVESGVDLLARAVRYNLDVGKGPGAVHHMVETRDRAASEPTAEAVEAVVASLVEADVSPLVDEAGMAVVGATPYAEDDGDIAAVEGRIARTREGLRSNRGVRFAAGGHVADLLLDAREIRPSLAFACRCRHDPPVADALDSMDWETVSLGRGVDIDHVRDIFAETEPTALLDRRRDSTVVFARDTATLRDRVLGLAAAVDD